MKKLVALLVALMMLGSVPAMADLSDADLSGLNPGNLSEIESSLFMAMSAMSMDGSDVVFANDELCTIYTDDLKITFDLTQSDFTYLTQDYSVSEEAYKRVYAFPTAAHLDHKENKIHLDIIDWVYDDFFTIRTLADLGIPGAEGTLANYDAASQIEIGEYYTSQLGGQFNGLKEVNNTLWIISDQDWCLNLTNGKVMVLNAVHRDHQDNLVKLEPEALEEILQFFSITSRY